MLACIVLDFSHVKPFKMITLIHLIKILGIVVPVLISVAFLTVSERKVMGSIQRRRGPNVVGFVGLLQAFADGLKLFTKETTIPSNADIVIFLFAPILSFTLSLVGWAVIPFSSTAVLSDAGSGILYILAVSSLNVYGIVLAGWSSNSKYAYLGSLRSAAQMISYEISIGLTFLVIIVCTGSLNLSEIVLAQFKVWLFIPLLPVFGVFSVSMLAETNRHPFDLPEAEAELVSGYNVEYSAMTFALFFLAEYSNMLLMSSLLAIVFLGGWLAPVGLLNEVLIPGSVWFSLKMLVGAVFFIITRATLPRYRYDQLMSLGWKCFLPLTLGYLVFTIGTLTSFNWLP